MLVDSHCHLDFPEFGPELDAVMLRARTAGVGTCVTVGTKISTFDRTCAIAERFEDVWCSIGSHPHEAAGEVLSDADDLLKNTERRKVVGVGETGLDYYYEHSSREAQARNFRVHIAAARASGLPLIVHTREADEDTIAILRDEMEEGAFRGLIHCFTAGPRLAKWRSSSVFTFRYPES